MLRIGLVVHPHSKVARELSDTRQIAFLRGSDDDRVLHAAMVAAGSKRCLRWVEFSMLGRQLHGRSSLRVGAPARSSRWRLGRMGLPWHSASRSSTTGTSSSTTKRFWPDGRASGGHSLAPTCTRLTRNTLIIDRSSSFRM